MMTLPHTLFGHKKQLHSNWISPFPQTYHPSSIRPSPCRPALTHSQPSSGALDPPALTPEDFSPALAPLPHALVPLSSHGIFLFSVQTCSSITELSDKAKLPPEHHSLINYYPVSLLNFRAKLLERVSSGHCLHFLSLYSFPCWAPNPTAPSRLHLTNNLPMVPCCLCFQVTLLLGRFITSSMWKHFVCLASTIPHSPGMSSSFTSHTFTDN